MTYCVSGKILDETRVVWSRIVMTNTRTTSRIGSSHADMSAESAEVLSRVRTRLVAGAEASTHSEGRLMTLQDVARHLAVSTRTVSRIVARGELQAMYLTPPNRTMRFERREVKRFIDSKLQR